MCSRAYRIFVVDDEEESYQPLVLPRCDEFKSFQRQVPAALKYIHGLKFDADYLKFVLMYSYEKALDPESSIWALTVNLHRETKLGRKRQNNYAAIAGLIKALKPKFRKQVPMVYDFNIVIISECLSLASHW